MEPTSRETLQGWHRRAQQGAREADAVMREVVAEVLSQGHLGQVIPLRREGESTPRALYIITAGLTLAPDGRSGRREVVPLLTRHEPGSVPVVFPPAQPGSAIANTMLNGLRPARAADLAQLLDERIAVLDAVDGVVYSDGAVRPPASTKTNLRAASYDMSGWGGH